MNLIVLQVIFIFLQYLESLHDSAMIDIQNYQSPNYSSSSEKWHRYSLYYYILMVFAVSYAANNLLFFIPLVFNRVFFAYFLNSVRTEKKGLFYLSDKGLDLQAKKILGKYAGQIILALGITLIVASNFAILNYRLIIHLWL